MRCEDARAALGLGESAEVRQHIDGCAECQDYERSVAALGRLLDTDANEEPRPGFDTRFFARLEEEKQRAVRRGPGPGRRGFLQRFGWALAGVATAAAAVAGVVIWRGRESQPSLSPDDLELAMHLDLLEDLDVVRNLEDVEAFDILAGVDDLDDLLDEKGG